jgi:hypothetical protein
MGQSVYTVENGQILLKQQKVKLKAFKGHAKEDSLMTRFMTFDIETIVKKGVHIPYLVNVFNGNNHLTEYMENLNDKQIFHRLITRLIELVKNLNGSIIIFAHNLGSATHDGVLLLEHLLPFGQVNPLVNNGRILQLELKTIVEVTNKKGELEDKEICLIFRDSLQLLPAPLRKLAKAFGIGLGKGFFPYLLNDIFYNGVLPSFELWSKILPEEYGIIAQEFANKVWDFKAEAIKYCKLDCEVLHKVLTIFNKLVFEEFSVNPIRCITLPSLAMIIYTSNFMPKGKLFQLLGPVAEAIRESYTGGAVDVYKPSFKSQVIAGIKQVLYYYDVNSLYPTVMANRAMPVGEPTYFEGNILKYMPDAFGFFYCKITSPDYLKHPILQLQQGKEDLKVELLQV